MSGDMAWLDDLPEDPARPVWAGKLPLAIDDLSKAGDALVLLFGGDVWLQQVGVFAVAYTTGHPCDCRSCSKELQRVLDTTSGLTASDCLNGPLNRMILCAECGNKRCPHALDHEQKCTGSNEPGQPGGTP